MEAALAPRRRPAAGRLAHPDPRGSMFFRTNQYQYHARPERPDPVYARKLQ